jgi:hypothetical protein
MTKKLLPAHPGSSTRAHSSRPSAGRERLPCRTLRYPTRLQPGGEVLVTETVTFRFEGGPFTYVFRNLSQQNTDGITFLEASLDGVPLPQGAQAGQVEVENGDPLKITWHFAPVSDQTHTFTLRYRIAGLIRTGAEDTLIRDVIPAEHDYRIETVSVFLNYLDGVRPLEAPTLNRAFDSSPTDTGTRLTAAGVAVDERVTLTARFPAKAWYKLPHNGRPGNRTRPLPPRAPCPLACSADWRPCFWAVSDCSPTSAPTSVT